MKLGIISTVAGYSWAGSEEMWKLLALEALRAGHQVAVSGDAPIIQSKEIEELETNGARLFPRSALGPLTRRLVSYVRFSRFSDLKLWNPDWLCISVGAPADPIWQPDLLRYIESTPIPITIIVQGNAEGLVAGEDQRIKLRKIYRSASSIICVSEQNAKMLERQLALTLPNSIVLPNPIRLRLEQPLPWPDKSDSELRFATVARFETVHKRQDHTLEALSTPEWRRRKWKLSFFGRGPDENYVRQLIGHFNLEDRVLIHGYVRDFRDIWARHHIHILNSHSEGLSLALIESMFCGRPAVVTHAGGNAELVRDGIDGFVSPGMHPEVIRETLERAWSSLENWQSMGKSAFSQVARWVPNDLGSCLLNSIFKRL